MKGRWLLCIPLILLIAGCATSKKVSSLEARIDSLEKKVNVAEQKQFEGETYLPRAEAPQTVITQVSKPKPFPSSLSKKDIQTALKNAGYYKGAIDGHIGKDTRKAIREFQKANGLKVDGIAGTKTRELLANYLTQ